jgi:putative ABC transport system substrate-binding protein
MGSISDPVGSGFVKSFAHPAGNITGLSSMSGDVNLKQLEMLIDMAPKLSRLAVLVHPSNIAAIKYLEMVQAEAQKRGMMFLRADARAPQEIDDAFSRIRQQNAGALMVLNDQFFTQQYKQVAELTAKHRLPCIAGDRIFAEAGVLMSYGTNLAAQYRRAAGYVDKILKGAKPGDIPVEQPTIFELIINGKTAKALGLAIPQSLLIGANKVID